MTTAIDTIVLDTTASLKTPDVSRLTTQSLTGTGVFDVLMKTTKLHLQEEYETGRITGAEYATLYLGATTAVLQQSVQFLLNTQQEERIQAEIALTRQKTVTELAQTDDTLPIGLGFNGDDQVEGLVASKKAIDALQASLVTSQIEASDANVALLGQKIVTELAQTGEDLTQASAAGYGFNVVTAIEGLIKAQKDQAEANILLTEQKVATEVGQTSDIKPVDLGVMASTSITGLIKAQKDKAESEVGLLSQKTATELAQTCDSIPMGLANNTTSVVGGRVAKENNLLGAQTDGYARDAEQKLTKMVLDVFSILVTQNGVDTDGILNLGSASINAILGKAKAGIDVS